MRKRKALLNKKRKISVVRAEEKDYHFGGHLWSISWTNGDDLVSTAPQRITVDCSSVAHIDQGSGYMSNDGPQE